ncbi:PQQ-binding-like beta-propeller repeat protein [Acidobacteria bacterium AH-259-A15]|nr:PQQ-binding-like beta-propeller repeat protein [Acidobacteria bacterium AH-259-A15]
MSLTRRTLPYLVLLPFVLNSSVTGIGQSPHGRNPSQNESSRGKGVFKTEKPGLEVVWKKSLGSGYSRVVVVEGRAITMFSDGEFDHLVALDAATGEEIWRYKIANTYRGHDGSDDGPISTPTVDEGVIYGLGRKGHLFTVRFANGREIWSKKIDEELGAKAPFLGFATTPIIEAEVLVVQMGGPDGRSICGFNKKTGERLWSIGDDKVGYQSSAVLTLAGQRQVVAVSNQVMMGILPQTGELLWKYQHSTTELDGSSQPIPLGEDKFLLTSSFSEYWSNAALYQVKKTEDGFAVEEIWRSNALKRSFAVPVLYGKHLYGFNGRFLTCVDPATGKEVWKSRPPGGRGLILVDGHLVIFAPKGVVVVAAASPEGYREKARLQISDRGSFTSPTFANGRIFVRNLTHITSIGVSEAAEVAELAPDESESAFRESKFGAFVRTVQAAEDKKTLIDEFMHSHEEFPIIEGDRLVHFVYRGQVEDIAIRGTMIDFYAPDPMERIEGTDFYYRSYLLPPNTRWDYAFNINFGRLTPDPLNPRRSQSPWGEKSELAMPGWVSPKHIEEPTGKRGRVESFNFKSEIRGNERVIKVYLPPGYDEGEERYPLLIVNNDFQALKSGKMDHSLDNLIGKSVAPVIVAFVAAFSWTDTTWQEYEYGGPATEKYAQMLAEELVPHLDEKYRTIAGAHARAIMGNWLGGLVSLYAALHHPQVFGKVAVQSLQLLRPVGDEVLSLVRGQEKQAVQFYVDWDRYDFRSTEFETFDLREDSRKFADLLKEKGYSFAGGEFAGGPGWGSWRVRTDKILEAFFRLKAKN